MSKKPSYQEELLRKKDRQIQKLSQELDKRNYQDRSAAPPPTRIHKRLGPRVYKFVNKRFDDTKPRYIPEKIRENEKISDYCYRIMEKTLKCSL